MKALGEGESTADAEFGGGFGEKASKAMDPRSLGEEADTLEWTHDIGIAGGLVGEVGAAAFGARFDVGASRRYESTTTLSKTDKGKLERSEQGQSATDLSLSVSANELKLAEEGTFTLGDDGARLRPERRRRDPQGARHRHRYVPGHPWRLREGDEAGRQQGRRDIGRRPAGGLHRRETRARALGGLEASGFIVPSLCFAFSMDDKGRAFAIEVVRAAEVDEDIGAAGGDGIDMKLMMGTKLLDKCWNAS